MSIFWTSVLFIAQKNNCCCTAKKERHAISGSCLEYHVIPSKPGGFHWSKCTLECSICLTLILRFAQARCENNTKSSAFIKIVYNKWSTFQAVEKVSALKLERLVQQRFILYLERQSNKTITITILSSKGQLISKGHFCFFNSPKKRMKNLGPSRLGQKFKF